MKRFLFAAALLWAAWGCTEPIDIDASQSGGQMVVYSMLMDEVTNQRVTVQRTVPYFSPAGTVDWVENAQVTITASTGQTYPAEWNAKAKAYLTIERFATAPNVTYELSVTVDGVNYRASATVLPPVVFDRITIEPVAHEVVSFSDLDIFQVKLYGQDPPGRNFYIFRVEVNGEVRNMLDNWMYIGDRMFQDGKIDGLRFMNFLGEPDPESEKEDGDDYWWAGPGSRISVLVSNVSEEMMDFVADVQPSDNGGNPLFGGPPHNADSNISGGALGYFGAIYSTRLSAVVPAHE